jgi:hypothetical protein
MKKEIRNNSHTLEAIIENMPSNEKASISRHPRAVNNIQHMARPILDKRLSKKEKARTVFSFSCAGGILCILFCKIRYAHDCREYQKEKYSVNAQSYSPQYQHRPEHIPAV